jgi:hypothetical protein
MPFQVGASRAGETTLWLPGPDVEYGSSTRMVRRTGVRNEVREHSKPGGANFALGSTGTLLLQYCSPVLQTVLLTATVCFHACTCGLETSWRLTERASSIRTEYKYGTHISGHRPCRVCRPCMSPLRETRKNPMSCAAGSGQLRVAGAQVLHSGRRGNSGWYVPWLGLERGCMVHLGNLLSIHTALFVGIT